MSSKTDIFEERAALFKEEKGDIFEERAQLLKEEESPSALKEISTQAFKGGAKGAFGTFGDILEAVGMREVASRQLGLPTEFIKIPTGSEIGALIEKLGGPGEAQTMPGRYSSRIGEGVGGALAFGSPIGALPAFAGGAALGQTAEELGVPENISGLVELLGTLGSGTVAKKLLPKNKTAQELVKRGRKLGLTESELSPLVKPKGRFNIASKAARKSGKLGEMAANIESKLGDSYKFVKEAAKESGRLKLKQRNELARRLEAQMKNLRKSHSLSKDKQTALKILDETTSSLRNTIPSYESLIESYQDINKASKGVRNILSPVKEEYKKLLSKKSPELAKDFEAANRVYAQFKDRLGKLKPDQLSDMWDKLEIAGVGGAIGGALLGYPWALGGLMGEVAGRSFAKQYLTNPYFQNLPNKFITSVLKDDKKAIRALANSLKKVLKRDYDLDEEDLSSRGNSS